MTPCARIAVFVAILALASAGPRAGAASEQREQAPVCSEWLVQPVDGDGFVGSPPFGDTACPGVRPGARVVVGETGCTLAFLVTDEVGRRYMATAGHCLVGSGLEQAWSPGEGRRAWAQAADGHFYSFGEERYAVLDGAVDFALVEVDAGAEVDPELCHFGGPTALYTDSVLHPEAIHHHGFGRLWRSVTPSRTGTTLGTFTHHFARAVDNAGPGDSGSPVITADGRALGVVARATQAGGYGAAYMEISRLDRHLERAAAVLGVELTLATAPLRTTTTAIDRL